MPFREPNHVGLPAQPRHLALGEVTGVSLDEPDGVRKRVLTFDVLDQLPVTEAAPHRLGVTVPLRDQILDFIEVAEEVSGRKLDWFFDQLLFGTGTLDYAVTEAFSERLGFEAGVFDTPEGRITRKKEEMEEQRERARESDDDPGPYRTTVVIQNHGTIRYPVEILVRFTDASEVRETWDGDYRWLRLTYERGEER